MNRFGTAAILAGGKSKRMGFDKQRICVNDKYLIDLLYEELNELFEHVIIVSNSPQIYSDRPYHVVSDEIEYGGPLTGIHKALKESQSEFVFITACDMPNLNHELITLMKSRLNQGDYCGSVSMLGEWIEPFHGKLLPVLHKRGLIPSLMNQNKKRLLTNLIRCESHREALISILEDETSNS